MKEHLKNNEKNFNAKVNKLIAKYKEEGDKIELTIAKHRFEMMTIAAKEGLKSFEKQAKERKCEKYVFDSIEEIREMTNVLYELAKISTVTIKMKRNEND